MLKGLVRHLHAVNSQHMLLFFSLPPENSNPLSMLTEHCTDSGTTQLHRYFYKLPPYTLDTKHLISPIIRYGVLSESNLSFPQGFISFLSRLLRIFSPHFTGRHLSLSFIVRSLGWDMGIRGQNTHTNPFCLGWNDRIDGGRSSGFK